MSNRHKGSSIYKGGCYGKPRALVCTVDGYGVTNWPVIRGGSHFSASINRENTYTRALIGWFVKSSDA